MGRAPTSKKGAEVRKLMWWGPVEELPIWERLMPRAASPIKACGRYASQPQARGDVPNWQHLATPDVTV